jgi:hypothetical protein
MIGGKPLPPGGTKFLRLHDFTRAMVDEIEHHQKVGNIQLLQQGRGGGEMDITELRKMLGWEIEVEIEITDIEVPSVPLLAPAIKDEPEAVVKNVDDITDESLDEDEGEPSEKVPADEPISAASSAPELPKEDSVPLAVDDILDPEDPPEVEHDVHAYTKDELMSLKGKDLREILVKVGGKVGSNKTKDALSDAILDLQPSIAEE